MNFDPGQDLDDLVFFWCENKAKVVPADRATLHPELNKTSVREKSRGVYLLIG